MIFIYFILSDAVIFYQFSQMIPQTPGFSPIYDNRGDTTIQIISTPIFISTPFFTTPHQEDSTIMIPNTNTENVCCRRRLTYSSDWTTDSEPEPESDFIDISSDDDVSSNPFVWSATP